MAEDKKKQLKQVFSDAEKELRQANSAFQQQLQGTQGNINDILSRTAAAQGASSRAVQDVLAIPQSTISQLQATNALPTQSRLQGLGQQEASALSGLESSMANIAGMGDIVKQLDALELKAARSRGSGGGGGGGSSKGGLLGKLTESEAALLSGLSEEQLRAAGANDLDMLVLGQLGGQQQQAAADSAFFDYQDLQERGAGNHQQRMNFLKQSGYSDATLDALKQRLIALRPQEAPAAQKDNQGGIARMLHRLFFQGGGFMEPGSFDRLKNPNRG